MAASTPPSSEDPELPLAREESDCGLLKLMADGKQPWADAAYRAFYERHSDYLYRRCARSARALNGDVWLEDVFNDTFAQAYNKSHQFTLPSEMLAAEQVPQVRAWLGTIAANFIRQKLRKFGREETRGDTAWEQLDATAALAAARAESVPNRSSDEQKLIDAALETLPERERRVLLVTFQYHRIGEKFQRLPNKVAKDLAETFATTPEYLRKIRERALATVRQYVEEHRQGSKRNFA